MNYLANIDILHDLWEFNTEHGSDIYIYIYFFFFFFFFFFLMHYSSTVSPAVSCTLNLTLNKEDTETIE